MWPIVIALGRNASMMSKLPQKCQGAILYWFFAHFLGMIILTVTCIAILWNIWSLRKIFKKPLNKKAILQSWLYPFLHHIMFKSNKCEALWISQWTWHNANLLRPSSVGRGPSNKSITLNQEDSFSFCQASQIIFRYGLFLMQVNTHTIHPKDTFLKPQGFHCCWI